MHHELESMEEFFLEDNQEFDRKYAFKVLKKLCKIGSRVVASEGEAKSAALIARYFEEFGLSEVKISKYPFTFYDGKEGSISQRNIRLLSGVPCWMSASTSDYGIEKETLYIGTHNNLSKYSKEDIQDKIVFVLLGQQYMSDVLEAWDKLFDMKPAGVIFLDRERDEAPRSYNYEKLNDTFSKAPSMTVSAKLARPFHDRMFGSTLKLTLRGQAEDGTLHNVLGRIQGHLNKTIIVCAHHDTVPFTMGATDNAAGVAIMIELARLLSRMDLNYSYQFIAFGGEELGMKGSQKLLETYDLSDTVLCLNFDSIGALPGQVLALSAGPDEMIEWITQLAQTNKYPARCRRAATSGGDNIPFAVEGIPTIHLACLGTTSEKVSHTAIDDISNLTSWSLFEVGTLATRIVQSLEASDSLPFAVEVPDDLLEAAEKKLASD